MPILTRKYRLQVVGDKDEVNRVYTYIEDSIKAQNKAMNEYMSALYASRMLKMDSEDKKQLNLLFGRITNSKKGSGYSSDIKFPKGLPIAATAADAVRKKFSNCLKEGLDYGNVSLPTYRSNNPLLVHVNYVALRGSKEIKRKGDVIGHCDTGIYQDYESIGEFEESIFKDIQPKIFIKFANNITFRVCFGNPYKSREARDVIRHVIEGDYVVGGSSIQITNNRKIIINLCLEIPQKEAKLEEEIVCGVDCGVAIPAMCALSNDNYKRSAIGNVDDFLRVRTQLQNQRRRLQKSLKNCNGGHGRNKKLKPLEKLSKKRKTFCKHV